MEEMITVITPTGDRPLAFALCQRWMENQTMFPAQWLVIDDGKIPIGVEQLSPLVEYIRREPQPNDPKHTLVANLQKAFPLIKGDKIIIIEDDEYYAPEYLAAMTARLAYYELVGIKNSKYYHLPSGGYCTHSNAGHASFAQTAFKATFLPTFKRCLDIRSQQFLDIRMWRNAHRRGFLFIDEPPLYLGIKGLPGRPGIGIGHDEKRYLEFDTPMRDRLKEWVPGDYQTYLDILEGKLTKQNSRSYFRGEQDGLHPKI
jgi:hypothetical protein